MDPIGKIGLEYPSLYGWDSSTSPPIVGVNVLDSSEFDLNILHPSDPALSPHWQSKIPASGQTYCSAWKLKIRDTTYILSVLVPGSEVFLGTYFFEGAADVYTTQGCVEVVVGKAFCEQMGYN